MLLWNTAAVNSVITNRHDGKNHSGPQMELTQIGLNFRTNVQNSIHSFTLGVSILAIVNINSKVKTTTAKV